MSYPQTPASQAVRNSFYNSYRLSTLLASPGDIYEIDASAKSIVIGPDSDVANVLVTYFDELVPVSYTNTALVSPDRSFVNLVSARLDVNYPNAGKKGRILASIADLYYPNISVLGGNNKLSVIPPRLDLITYFSEPPSVVPQRSDGLWFFEDFTAVGAGGTSYTVIPYWGRKFADLTFINAIGIGITVDYELVGVNYLTNGYYTVPIDTAAAVANGAVHQSVVRASVNGMFDALRFGFKPSTGSLVNPITTKIVTSDNAL